MPKMGLPSFKLAMVLVLYFLLLLCVIFGDSRFWTPIFILTATWRARLQAKYDALARVAVSRSIDTTINRQDVTALPDDLYTADDEWIISLERAVKIVPREQLLDDVADLDGLLVRYLQANMEAFAQTPQGWLFWWKCEGDDAKDSFEDDYLENLKFEPGDLVCGVFRAKVRSAGRIELVVEPHESLRRFGDARGVVAARISEDGGQVTFTNDTVMWRKRVGEPKTLIETKLGGWLHKVMIMWLVDSGTKSVLKKRFAFGAERRHM